MEDPEGPWPVRWDVKVDNLALGFFSSCEGLGMEVVLEQREEGGNNDFVWQLPTRIKYSNIKLSRPVCANTQDVIKWVVGIIQKVEPTTATIRALPFGSNDPVAQWSLHGVIPIRWTGPSMNADSSKMATETIEFAHHGFTELRT